MKSGPFVVLFGDFVVISLRKHIRTMKTRLLLALFLLFAAPLAVLAIDAPKAVQQAFAKKYPQTNPAEVTWQAQGTSYEAHFKLSGSDASALFDGTGKLLQTENAVLESQLPSGVVNYVNTHCATPVVRNPMVTRDGSGAVKYYEVKACGSTTMRFDASGNFVKNDDQN